MPDKAHLEVVDLMSHYSRAIGDREIEAWPAFFAEEDPTYQVTTLENYERGLPLSLILDDSRGKIEDRVIMVRDIWTGNFEKHRLRHFTSVTSVEPQNGELAVRSNVVVYRTGPEGHSELFVVGEAQDQLTRRVDGQLCFRVRCVVLDTHVLPYSLVYPI